jgi:hypothetical protein
VTLLPVAGVLAGPRKAVIASYSPLALEKARPLAHPHCPPAAGHAGQAPSLQLVPSWVLALRLSLCPHKGDPVPPLLLDPASCVHTGTAPGGGSTGTSCPTGASSPQWPLPSQMFQRVAGRAAYCQALSELMKAPGPPTWPHSHLPCSETPIHHSFGHTSY